MRGVSSGRSKRYAKSCHMIKQLYKKKDYPDHDYSPFRDHIYNENIVEYKEPQKFFEYYLPCDDVYQVRPSFRELKDNAPLSPTEGLYPSTTSFYSLANISRTRVRLCDNCNERPCSYTSYFQNQWRYAISIENRNSSTPLCKNCRKPLYLNKENNISIHDVRLLGHPLVLGIRRIRKYCSACETFYDDNPLIGLQAFCDSVMTPRLATATLRAYLSDVKRSEITEAYGISNSQVNRIKKRMIELIRSRNTSNALEEVKSRKPKIMCSHSEKHEYYAYFYKDVSGEEMLADILTEEQHNWVNELKKGSASDPKDFFSDEADWILAGIVVLVGESELSWKEAFSKLKDYCHSFTHYEDTIEEYLSFSDSLGRSRIFHALYLSTTDDQEKDEDVESVLPTIQDQFILREFYDEGSDNPYSTEIIADFIAQLSSALGKKRWQRNPRLLFDQLLYFNPAAISAIELYWFTGERYNGINLQALGSQCEARMPRRWGVPVRCLTYLMKNGLLKDQQHSLLPCYLVRHDYSASSLSPADENNLPCKMKNTYCVHCHDTI